MSKTYYLFIFFLNLILNFKSENGDYLISFKEINELRLRIAVDNTKKPSEPSYGTIVNIKFDNRLDFIKLEVKNAIFNLL